MLNAKYKFHLWKVNAINTKGSTRNMMNQIFNREVDFKLELNIIITSVHQNYHYGNLIFFFRKFNNTLSLKISHAPNFTYSLDLIFTLRIKVPTNDL